MTRDRALVCSVLLLVGCGRSMSTVRTTAAFRLQTAVEEPTQNTLSCHGGAFCREDLLAVSTEDAVSEVSASCARFGGTLSRSTCPRRDVVASCSGSTEQGTAVVFTYRQAEVERVSSLCEAMGGSFEGARGKGQGVKDENENVFE